MRGLEKSFGATEVLRGVNFTVRPGQIHALLGGNGAGKSTMIRIITGTVAKNGGTVKFPSASGEIPVISVVHQELALLPDLTVSENIGLPHIKSGFSVYDARKSAKIAAESLSVIAPKLAEHGLHQAAKSLSLHERQIVEIARALSTGAEVLLLDEPTANLTAAETEKLFTMLKGLAHETGIAIVFVSHRMKEIRQLCDVCTIIRDGKTVVDSQPFSALSDADIVLAMGHPARRNQSIRPAGRSTKDKASDHLVGPGLSLPVQGGRILGLAGAPVGPAKVIASLIGANRQGGWSITGPDWPDPPHSPSQAVRNGVGFVTGDRANKGMLAQLPIIDNMLVSRRVRERRHLVKRFELAECSELIKALKVMVSSVWNLPGSLSGGNQQKLLIARWLEMSLKMTVFEEPTRGVDIGTKRDIYELIRQMAANGTLVVWWSTENAELLELCDEILTFDIEGRPMGLLPPDAFNEDALAELTGMAA